VKPLLIAEAANPEWTSVPLEGWCHSRAIQQLTGGHILTQIRNQAAFERAGVGPDRVTCIDSEHAARPLNRLAELIRGGSNKGWTTVTAIQSLAYPFFERIIWKQFESRLRSGEFDLVHRLTPLSPTISSLLAAKVSRAGVPFVLGPLNGGVPWPRQFDSARRREREWLSYVRSLHRYLPGFRATRRHAAAIICGSKATLNQMPAWCRDRCIYIPENAVDPVRFPKPGPKPESRPMRIAFVGRLVPYKGADMLLEAAAPLVRAGQVVIDVIGDGPERSLLEDAARREQMSHGVTFAGWVPHTALAERLALAHVFGFPSIREFGGAVVLEAMAQELVPIVVDYGGPGELVTPETGIAVAMSSRDEIVSSMRNAITELANNPSRLSMMGAAARKRVMANFTWDAKARQVVQVYRWVLGQGPRPEFECPLSDSCPPTFVPAHGEVVS
jgi:starch synthase